MFVIDARSKLSQLLHLDCMKVEALFQEFLLFLGRISIEILFIERDII